MTRPPRAPRANKPSPVFSVMFIRGLEDENRTDPYYRRKNRDKTLSRIDSVLTPDGLTNSEYSEWHQITSNSYDQKEVLR